MNTLTLAGVAGAGNRTIGVAALLSLAIVLSACDGKTASPTSASPTSPTSSETYTLSGTVSEMTTDGPAAVQGARVEELTSGRSAMTNASGHFNIAGLPATTCSLSITKEEFVPATTSVLLNSNTQLDIQLDRKPTFTLSGVVFEATPEGNVPIEGVEVYCDSCGSPVGHTFANTDADGFYSFAWAANGVHPLFVTKDGYTLFDPTGRLQDRLGRISATVNGDTRFNIQLVRR